MTKPTESDWADVARVALAEDLGGTTDVSADVTSRTTIPEDLSGTATVYAKQDGVVAGLPALDAVYGELDQRVHVNHKATDGDEVRAGDVLVTISGPVRSILVGERTALNLVGHLSGIASNVATFVKASGRAKLVDTRKTLPGLRKLQKYAVKMGGGRNHRTSLVDGVLIKDTHIVAAGGVGEAVRRAKAGTELPVQAECQSLEEVDAALEAGADQILLDNRAPDELASLTRHIRERAPLVLVEASGGVTLENVAAIAASGVDRISIGAFTHSSPSLDVSLELEG
jgi:nicotinate-nucleotide pyrophosphorylase (carboxylating)